MDMRMNPRSSMEEPLTSITSATRPFNNKTQRYVAEFVAAVYISLDVVIHLGSALSERNEQSLLSKIVKICNWRTKPLSKPIRNVIHKSVGMLRAHMCRRPTEYIQHFEKIIEDDVTKMNCSTKTDIRHWANSFERMIAQLKYFHETFQIENHGAHRGTQGMPASYNCKLVGCELPYENKADMLLHRLYVHGAQPAIIPCPLCTAEYYSSEDAEHCRCDGQREDQ